MAVDTERHIAGTVFRAIGLLLVVGFIALLTYGLLTEAPNTTIDEALSKAQAVPGVGAGSVVHRQPSTYPAARSLYRRLTLPSARQQLLPLRNGPSRRFSPGDKFFAVGGRVACGFLFGARVWTLCERRMPTASA